MNISEIVEELRRHDVRLSVDRSDNLRVVAGPGVLTESLRGALKANKAALIAWIRETERKGAGSRLPPLAKHGRRSEIPLSHAQERLWLAERMAGSGAYNAATAWRVRGTLNEQAMIRALERITARHEILRTAFRGRGGRPFQEVLDEVSIDYRFVDLAAEHARGEAAEAHLSERMRAEAALAFDLEKPPLFRVRAYRLADDEHALLFCFHHIVVDGWSMRVLRNELDHYYDQHVVRGGAELDEPPVQYADYAIWQRDERTETHHRSLLGYWRDRLAGWERLDLQHDRPKSSAVTRPAGHFGVSIGKARTELLRSAARGRNVTLFTFLLAAFYVLLFKHTGQRDLTIGTDVAGRSNSRLEKLVGFFVNQLVLRQRLNPAAPFAALLEDVKESVQGAYAHQELPFSILVNELLDHRDLAVSPFFPIKFTMQNFPDESARAGSFGLEELGVPSGDAKFEMTWSLAVQGGELGIVIEYDSELYTEQTIRSLVRRYETVLGAVAEDPHRVVSLIDLATEDDRRLYEAGNALAAAPVVPVSLAGVVEDWAARTPDAKAVVDAGGVVSYAELNGRANRLARRLIALGAGPEARVGVCMQSGIDYVTTVLAVSKACAVLVPIDHRLPEKRIAQILEDASPAVLVGSRACEDVLPAYELNFLEYLCLDAGNAEQDELDDTDLWLARHPQQASYLIYTSGTSGQPKGVVVAETGLGKLVQEGSKRLAISRRSKVLQFSSIGFDASVWEIMTTLGNGATLHCDERNEIMPGVQLARYLTAHGITHVTLPPSALEVMPDVELPTLEILILAGEKVKDEVVRRWRDKAEMYNAYGPSEATVCATVAPLGERDGFDNSIGTPIRGSLVYVVGSDGGLAPTGVPGELCVGGPSVGRGYWGNPSSTADKFVPDAFSGALGARLYRTGDRARYLPTGEIQFLGRIDKQIKLRGYRIEPEEIEKHLLRHESVRQAVVVVPADLDELCAFVVPSGAELCEKTLKAWLRERLPEYMVPAYIVRVESVPTNVNGKTDVGALPPVRAETHEPTFADDVLSEAEAGIRALWLDLLKRNDVGKHQNFFDVGGNSLLLVGLQERIQQELGREIAIADLFKHPTIASLAAFLEADAGDDGFTSVDERLSKRRSAGRRRPRNESFSKPIPAGDFDGRA